MREREEGEKIERERLREREERDSEGEADKGTDNQTANDSGQKSDSNSQPEVGHDSRRFRPNLFSIIESQVGTHLQSDYLLTNNVQIVRRSVQKRNSKIVINNACVEFVGRTSFYDAKCMEVRFNQHHQIRRSTYQIIISVRKECASRTDVFHECFETLSLILSVI